MSAAIPPALLRRLCELPGGAAIDESALTRLARLGARVIEDPHAPTTVREAERVVDDHLADSLVALALPEITSAGVLADLGSGAGFPCLALAAVLTSARFRAVESNARKCAFIATAAREAGIANVETVCARAEEWRDGREANDVVTARALAPLPVVAEYAAPLLRTGGILVVWRGRRDPAEEEAGARAAAELGLRPQAVIRVHPYPAASDRHLHLFEKAGATPGRFPRRAGMARKRPLGS